MKLILFSAMIALWGCQSKADQIRKQQSQINDLLKNAVDEKTSYAQTHQPDGRDSTQVRLFVEKGKAMSKSIDSLRSISDSLHKALEKVR